MTVVADNDEPGLRHARQVAASLATVVPEVRIVRAATGKDAADHLDAGRGLDDFVPLEPSSPPTEVSTTAVWDPASDEQSDDELHRSQLRMAERLADVYGSRLRYAHGLGWLEWDGTRWRHERDGASMRAAVDVVKQAVHEATGGDQPDDDLAKDVRKVETYYGLRGVLQIALNLEPLAVAASQLDADPLLLNTTSGTLDLRTGTVRTHDPSDLLAKVTGCGLEEDPLGAEFHRFLAEILPDADVRSFVQRLFGYALLGRVAEHVLPIFVGTGCNGKSTLVELLLRTLGVYAIAADPELLVEQRHAQHPTGQADLHGFRLAVTQETDEGRRLAAATVKRLTGGDKIRARKMRQDFFEFDPSHTVVMVTNHQPRVSGDDPALWRRIRVVPFDVVVEQPDPALPLRLRQELPAVLAWAVEGYREYERLGGLAAPSAVTDRTSDYRGASDLVGRFLEEQTTARASDRVRSRGLFEAWQRWCHAAGEQLGSEVTFAQSLARKGHEKRKTHGVIWYLGLDLAPSRDQSVGLWEASDEGSDG